MGKKIKDKIKEIKTLLVSNSKNARHTETLIADLLKLHKAQESMNKIVDVPIAEVTEELDFGAWSLHKTNKGILFTAKGGMYTFVEMGMTSVYTMLQNIFEMKKDEEQYKDMLDTYTSAVAYVFQCPIFASLDQPSLFSIATEILKVFNDFCNTNYLNAKDPEYTEEDIKKDFEQQLINEGIEKILDSPLPPELEEKSEEE